MSNITRAICIVLLLGSLCNLAAAEIVAVPENSTAGDVVTGADNVDVDGSDHVVDEETQGKRRTFGAAVVVFGGLMMLGWAVDGRGRRGGIGGELKPIFLLIGGLMVVVFGLLVAG